MRNDLRLLVGWLLVGGLAFSVILMTKSVYLGDNFMVDIIIVFFMIYPPL